MLRLGPRCTCLDRQSFAHQFASNPSHLWALIDTRLECFSLLPAFLFVLPVRCLLRNQVLALPALLTCYCNAFVCLFSSLLCCRLCRFLHIQPTQNAPHSFLSNIVKRLPCTWRADVLCGQPCILATQLPLLGTGVHSPLRGVAGERPKCIFQAALTPAGRGDHVYVAIRIALASTSSTRHPG
jgi:hypothetical protein